MLSRRFRSCCHGTGSSLPGAGFFISLARPRTRAGWFLIVRARLKAGQPAELSSGTQIRDFLDVREAGRMIVEAALGPVQGPVNICSGKPITVRQLAETIADEFGRRDLLRFGARPDNLVDPPCVVGIRAGN